MYFLSKVADLVEGEAGNDPPVASFNIAVIPTSGPQRPLILQFGGSASPNDWMYAWSAASPKTSAELSWLAGTSVPVEIPVSPGARQISIFVQALADTLQEGDESLDVSLAPSAAGSLPQNVSIRIQDKQTALATGVQILLQADNDAIGEGDTASFTIRTFGLAQGTRLTYKVEGLTSLDLDNVALSGSATVDARGIARVLMPIRNDNLLEGTETIILRLTGASGQSASQLVLDTSTPIVDYSNLPSAPSPLWFAPTSSSSTSGSSTAGGGATLLLSNTLQGGSDPVDYIRFSVPASQRLSRFVLEDYDSVDGVAFIALERGMGITATETNPSPLSGYQHFGNGIPGLGEGANLLQGLGGPLEAGNYSLWIQQVGAVTSYRLRLSTVPIPDTPVLVLGQKDDELLLGSTFADSMGGAGGNDLILGREGADSINGGEGNDTLAGGAGNDRIDGGSGVDSAIYQYARTDYAIRLLADGSYEVRYLATGQLDLPITIADGTDTLSSIERLQFADRSIAYDFDGNAGKTAKVIAAVFGKTAVANADYVGIGLYYLEKLGFSDEDLMQVAIAAALGGAPTAERYRQLVDLLYTNVVGSKPSEADAKVFVQLLADKVYTPVSLGLFASETTMNLANLDLVGLASQGLDYIPFAT